MAFGVSLYGGSFTTNCLDDIPFKLGPKFNPPTKIVLPPELRASSQSSALNADYTFEVEEAVIKWSAEREKQLAEQHKLEQEKSEKENDEDSDNGSNTTELEPLYENQTKVSEPVYENASMMLPKPAPRPGMKPKPKDGYSNVLVPNPLIANISSDILMPIQSNSSGENSEISSSNIKPVSKSNDLDLTWFEKEDDPFNNLELQTINDMEELASVLEETKKASPEPPVVQSEFSMCSTENVVNETKIEQIHNGTNEHESDDDLHNYENVELKLVDLKIEAKANGPVGQSQGAGSSMTDIMNLPPVPPRRNLACHTEPLPPIQHSISEATVSQTVNQGMNSNVEQEDKENNISIDQSFPKDEKARVISKRRVPLPKPPRSFTYSRHDLDDDSEADKSGEPNYDNIQPKVSMDIVGKNTNVQFTNVSNCKPPDLQSKGKSCEELNFDHQHFGEECGGGGGVNDVVRPRPAPRKPPLPLPKPPQPLNRHSPLPPTHGSVDEHVFSQPATSALSKQTYLYGILSEEARGTVDKLASMGFPKETVVRAVEKIGLDEKEVVEYLCLLDQVTEKGYSTFQAENALLIFKNSMQQACTYLELYTQLQELGFNGDKIKEALVDTNNDREKTLDILTASS